MKKKVTLDDIVRLTGLSKYTVSRALSGKPGINEKTRDKVLKAAKELGYFRKTAAGKGQILLFIPQSDLVDATFWMNVVHGIEGEAAKNDYLVYIRTLNADEPINTVSCPPDVQGIIYASHKSVEIMRLMPAEIPSILFSLPPEPLADIDTIGVADYEGGFVIGKRLIEWGHRDFAFYGTLERPSHKERFRGMQSALLASNLDFKYIWSFNSATDHRENQMGEIFAELIRENKMPTAIMCITNALAASLLWTLNSLGISIPNEVSLTGFDSDPKFIFDSPITSIGIDKQEIGVQAFSLLMDRIQNPNASYKRLNIVPKLIVRKTAGPAPVARLQD